MLIGKRRTRQHIIVDLSANHVERHFLLSGHTAERVQFDFGYDLFVQTFDERGELEPDFFVIQLKATDTPHYVARDSEYALTIERRDLELWLRNQVPVFLILYDAANDAGYWLEVQSALARRLAETRTGTTVMVRLPAANRVDADAIATMRRIKNRL